MSFKEAAAEIKNAKKKPKKKKKAKSAKEKKAKPSKAEKKTKLKRRTSVKRKVKDEIIEPEFDNNTLQNAQLEYMSLVHVLANEDLRSTLWPRLEAGHYSDDANNAIFQRLHVYAQAGKEFPSIAVLAADPALPDESRALLESTLSRVDRGLPLTHAEIKVGNAMVRTEDPRDFDTHVFDVLESFRFSRISVESFTSAIEDATNKTKTTDPLDAPKLFEKAASKVLEIRAQDSVADVTLTVGYGMEEADHKKIKDLIENIFSPDKPRFLTGHAAYDDAAGGFQAGEVVVIGANTGGGKCVTARTNILTSEGILEAREVCADIDEGYTETSLNIFGKKGVEEASHLYKEKSCEVVEITTSLGYWNEGTHEHRVQVVSSSGAIKWKRHGDIEDGDSILIRVGQEMWGSRVSIDGFGYKSYHKGHDLPVPQEITCELASVMGYLVSEGTVRKNKLEFTMYDKEVREDYLACFNTCFPGFRAKETPCGVTHSSHKKLLAFFDHIGLHPELSRKKQIPRSIRQAPREYVIEFLRALYEGDGYINNDGKHNIYYTTTSRRLHDQLKTVLANLGIVTSTCKQWKTATNGREGNSSLAYTLTATNENALKFLNEVGFISERKRAQAEELRSRIEHNQNSRTNKPKHMSVLAPLYVATYNEARSLIKGSLTEAFGTGNRNWFKNSADRGVITKPMISAFVKNIHDLGLSSAKLDRGLKKLTRLLPDEYVVDPVVSVRMKKKRKTVYDLVVPGTHSFCANGMVQHNTAFMLTTMLNMYRMGTSSAMLQLELMQQQTDERISANIADVDGELIRTGKITEHPKLKKQIDEAWEDLKEEGIANKSRFQVYTPSASTVQGCEFVFKRFPYRVWFVDYINLLDEVKQSDAPWLALGKVVKSFKALAKKYGVAIVLAVQINIDAESGDFKARYSGAIEEDADVFFAWNLTKEDRENGVVWARHKKARQYDPFDFPLGVDLKHARFTNYTSASTPTQRTGSFGAAKNEIEAEKKAKKEGKFDSGKRKSKSKSKGKKKKPQDDIVDDLGGDDVASLRMSIDDLVKKRNQRAKLHIPDDDLDEAAPKKKKKKKKKAA